MIELEGKRFYRKQDGTLVPEELVKDKDKLRDDLVNSLAKTIFDLRNQMVEIKKEVMEDMEQFMQLMAEKYDVTMNNEASSFSLSNYDGSIRLQISSNDYIRYNEEVLVAKELIDEYLDDITKDTDSSVKQIVSAAFRLKQGRLDSNAIGKLRQLNINDEKWIKAMSIIDNSREVISGGRSLRIYKNKEMVDMNFSMI